MAKISKSKLKEILSNQNMSEGIIDRILSRLKVSKNKSKSKDLENKQKDLHKQLDALTNKKEYQAILKKHNIKPIDFLKNYEL